VLLACVFLMGFCAGRSSKNSLAKVEPQRQMPDERTRATYDKVPLLSEKSVTQALDGASEAPMMAAHKSQRAGSIMTMMQMTELGKQFQQFSKVNTLPAEFADKGIEMTWPFLSEFARHIIEDFIVGSLNIALPDSLGCTVVVGESTDIGKITPQFSDIIAIPVEKHTHSAGKVKNIRIQANIVYAGDAQISLDFKLMQRTHVMSLFGALGLASKKESHLTTVSVGVDDIEVRGVVVIEFVNLTGVPPFFGGLRIYFANMPTIDFSLTGSFGAVLNMSWVKSMILDAAEGVFGGCFVLPNQLVVPVDSTLDPWMFIASRPDGYLGLTVLEIIGMSQDVTAKVTMELGCERKETIAVPGKSGSYHWKEGNETYGLVQDVYAQWIGIKIIQEESSVLFGKWQGAELGRCAVDVSELLRTASRWNWTCWLCFSKADSNNPTGWPVLRKLGVEPDEGVSMRLKVEWRPTVPSREMSADKIGREYKNLCMIGIDKMTNVPFDEDPARKYWVNIELQDKDEVLKEESCRRPAISTYTPLPEAYFEHPLTFEVKEPRGMTVKLTLRTLLKGGSEEILGTTTFTCLPEIDREVYHNVVQAEFPLEDATKSAPKIRTVMRLWAIGPKVRSYVSRGSMLWSDENLGTLNTPSAPDSP